MNQSTRSYHWYVGLLVVALMGLGVLCLLALWIFQATLIEHAGQDLQRTATDVAEKLDRLLVDRSRNIEHLSHTLSEMKYGKKGRGWTDQLYQVQQQNPLYSWLGVLDSTGRVVVATDPASIGRKAEKTDWLRELGSGPAVSAYDVRRDQLSEGKDVVEFSHLIQAHHQKNQSRSFDGVVVGRIATAAFQTVVDRLILGQTLIIDSKRRLEYQILAADGRIILESALRPNESVNLMTLEAASVRRLASGSPSFVQEDHQRRHVPVLTGSAQMPSRQRGMGRWNVLVRLEREEVLGPIDLAFGATTMWSGLMAIPLLGLLLWVIVRLRTERSRVEDASQASTEAQKLFQSSLDALTSHIAILDERATIIAVNKAWRSFGDYNQLRVPNYGIGRNYLDICDSALGDGSEEARRVAKGIRAVLQGEQSGSVASYSCDAPSEARRFLVHISRFNWEDTNRIVIDHQNVSDSWLAVRDLLESQASTQTIINNTLDAHVLTDQDGVVRGWNPKAQEIFGWSFHEARGQSMADLVISPLHRETYMRSLKKVLNSETASALDKRIEIEGWHKDGRPFPIELTVTSLKGHNGFQFSVFIRNITEHIQQERRQAAEHRIAELLLETTSLDAVSQDIIKTICDTLEWRLGILWRVDETRQVMRYVDSWTGMESRIDSFLAQSRRSEFEMGLGLPGRVWMGERVEWISDVTSDRNFPRIASATEAGLHAAFAFPIKLEGKVQAVMEFFSEAIRPPDQKLQDLFSNMSVQLSHFLTRQVAERNLRRSEARFSGILQLAEDAIVSVDESQQIVLFNKSAERIFGYAEKELLWQPFDRLILLQDMELNTLSTREASSGARPPKLMLGRREVTGRRKGGIEFPAEASIARVTVEGETTYTIILRDISARKQEEQALKDAKTHAEHLVNEKKALLATVQAFFIQLTESGVVCEWTAQAEKLFGLSLSQAKGRMFHELPIDWNWETVSEAIHQVSRTLTTVHLNEVRIGGKASQQRFLKLAISPLCNNSSVDAVIMGEDITDHLLLEHDLAQAQKLESIGQLAAGIAHEINTPIQFVGDNIGFLSDSFNSLLSVLDRYRELLAANQAGSYAQDMNEACKTESERADLDYLREEIPKAIDQSADGIKRIAKIVRAMKEFAHPGSEEKTSVDLNKAIESTITVSRNEWKYVANLTTDLSTDIPPILCLLGPINQMILNMIVNAAHAIGEAMKGTEAKGLIAITTRLVGEWVEIRITDTGTGIPEDIRHKIFDPFFTTKPVGKGTGQGLAIARSVVVDKHAGTIAVESQVGKGTTFIIRLPLKTREESHLMEEAA